MGAGETRVEVAKRWGCFSAGQPLLLRPALIAACPSLPPARLPWQSMLRKEQEREEKAKKGEGGGGGKGRGKRAAPSGRAAGGDGQQPGGEAPEEEVVLKQPFLIELKLDGGCGGCLVGESVRDLGRGVWHGAHESSVHSPTCCKGWSKPRPLNPPPRTLPPAGERMQVHRCVPPANGGSGEGEGGEPEISYFSRKVGTAFELL